MAAPAGEWVTLPDRLGAHDGDAVARAARHLESEGFLDLDSGLARVRQ